jgi:hypothetical protein
MYLLVDIRSKDYSMKNRYAVYIENGYGTRLEDYKLRLAYSARCKPVVSAIVAI